MVPNVSDIDECRQFPCGPNGACTNTPGDFNCTCTNGYEGLLCDKGK